jgi:RES domain
MYCCESCFNDLYLKTKIKDGGKIGYCDYCEGTEPTVILSVSKLTDLFSKLLNYYSPTEPYEDYIPEIHDDPIEFGDKLVTLINEDWNIFSTKIQGTGTDERLLFDILDTNFSDPLESFDQDTLFSRIQDAFNFLHPLEGWEVVWEEFKKDLKHKNRFFPKWKDEVFNEAFKEVLYNRIIFLGEGLQIYRARTGQEVKEQMKAPPADKATAGRANPHGISYLYCARDTDTCISEVRPWKGAIITVAALKIKKDLKLLNLQGNNLCPFLFDSPEQVFKISKLLTHFSSELSKPVDPTKSEIEYLPTQYMTELIKENGFDGIYFNSSLGPGINVVLFDQNNVEVDDTRYYEVSNISYEFNEKNREN